MYVDAANHVSNVLFYLTGGVPVIESPWFFPYIWLTVLLAVIPMIAIRLTNSYYLIWPLAISGVIGFLVLFGAGLSQGSALVDCRSSKVNYENGHFVKHECRYRDSVYEGFGNWHTQTLTIIKE